MIGCPIIGCIFIILFMSFRTVPPAYVGIVVTFGQISNRVLYSGLHVCNPLSSVTSFSTKTTKLEQTNFVPTSEGLNVELDVAVLYHLEPDKVLDLFMGVGPDFKKIVIVPELSSAVRELTSQGQAKNLYSSGRDVIQAKLKLELQRSLKPRGIMVEAVLLKAIVLPEMVRQSIEAKAQAEQAAARMQFVLQKETQEAERKQIEAGGIATFQKTVSQGINDNFLRWKGIQATESLVKSKNEKVIVMGNGPDGLPVIFNSDNTIAGPR